MNPLLTRRATAAAVSAALLVIFGVVAAVRAETLTLTLEKAISLGLENSPDLRAARLAVQSSEKDVAAAKAAYSPGVTLGSDYSHSFNSASRAAASSAPDQLGVSLGLSQPLVTFGQLGNAVREAVDNLDIAKLDANEKQRSFKVDIQRKFYGYLLYREALSVKKETLAQREETLEAARTRFDAGLSTKRDVLQAESDLKSFVPELIAAQNDLEYALLNLKNIVGIGNEVDVEVVGDLDVPPTNPDREKIIGEALAKNSGIRRQELTIALGKAQERLSKSEKFPTVSGFVSARVQNGYDFGSAGFRGGDWNSTVSTGLSAQLDLASLFPWSAKTAKVRKSGVELRKQDEVLKSTRDTVSLGAEKVLLDLSKARAQIDAGKKALELAQELYLSTKEMYENGLVSITDYSNAQVNLSDSRIGYLTYVYTYLSALYDLMDAIGTDSL